VSWHDKAKLRNYVFPEQNSHMPKCSAGNWLHGNLPKFEIYLQYTSMTVSWMSNFENNAVRRVHNCWICIFSVSGFAVYANFSLFSRGWQAVLLREPRTLMRNVETKTKLREVSTNFGNVIPCICYSMNYHLGLRRQLQYSAWNYSNLFLSLKYYIYFKSIFRQRTDFFLTVNKHYNIL
jgi:hypothetical protein